MGRLVGRDGYDRRGRATLLDMSLLMGRLPTAPRKHENRRS
jgi:hypothetical protein